MLANFKKFGVAAAVAAAIGASGAAQAVTLGEPGGALLIPHVIFSSKDQVNTLVGITVGDRVPVGQFDTIVGEGAGCSGDRSKPSVLHWYFFSTKSVHLADGTVPVTCNDFSRFDWGFVITNPKRPFPSLNGVPGYLVLSSDDRRNVDVGSNYSLYGSAYLVQGNWASEAYIPVLPLLDDSITNFYDEVKYKGGIPDYVNPQRAGMGLANATAETARFSLRYTLPVAGQDVNATTSFVFWFPDNSGDSYIVGDTTVGRINRVNMPIDVYDADEVAVSNIISLPDELNIVDASKIDGTINDPTGHSIPDMAGTQPALNAGFVLFQLADYTGTLNPAILSRAGVAFSLIGIEGGASDDQVQTDLAHERGVWGR
jgi:hypothetical protein